MLPMRVGGESSERIEAGTARFGTHPQPRPVAIVITWKAASQIALPLTSPHR